MNRWMSMCALLISLLYVGPALSQQTPWSWKLTIYDGNLHQVDQKTFTSRKASEEYLWGLSPIHSTLKKVSSLGKPNGVYQFKYEGLNSKSDPGRRVYGAYNVGNGPVWFAFYYDEGVAIAKGKELFTKLFTDRGLCAPIYENEAWGSVDPQLNIWGSRYKFYGARIIVRGHPLHNCPTTEVIEYRRLVSSHQICEYDDVQQTLGYYCISPPPFDVMFNLPRTNDVTNGHDPSGSQLFIRSNIFAELEGRPNFCSPTRGNPCEISTGVKQETAADTFDYGDLNIVRKYTTAGGVNGSFGNWAGPFDYRMDVDKWEAGRSFTSPDGLYIKFDNLTGILHSQSNPNVLARTFVATDSSVHIAVQLSDRKIVFNDKGLPIQITLGQSQPIVLRYDGLSRLISATSATGRALLFNYADDSRLISSVLLPDNRLLDYTYEANQLREVRFENSRVFWYGYHPNSGLLASIELADGKVKNYLYDNERRLTSSAFGPSTFGYAYQPDRTIITHPSGRLETVLFEPAGYLRRPKLISTPGAADVVYDYTDTVSSSEHTTRVGDRATTTKWVGLTKTSTETVAGSVYKRADETISGGVLRPLERKVFDAASQLVSQEVWTYNTRGQTLTRVKTDPTTSEVRIATDSYCEEGNIASGTCPLLGLLTSFDGPRTDVADLTTFTYYPSDDPNCGSSLTVCNYRKGDLWKTTTALSQVIEYLQYDGAGRVVSVKDSNGVVTDLEYHPRGWLTARKVRGANAAAETDDEITRIDYWPTGLVKKVTQSDGAFMSFAYDAAHRLTDITDGGSNTIRYLLDNAGNKTGEDTKDVQGALKRTLSRVYNQLGQLQTQKDASQNPTGFTYDANGNINTVTDALSRVTDNDYDPLNRLQRTLQDVGGISAETKFQYDALDNLVKVTDPKGLDTNYIYSGFGDLTRLASPDTGVTTYTYDSGGNRKTQLDSRSTTASYSYDVLNRLTGITYPTTGLNVVYTYDASQPVCATGETFSKGRLTKLTDSSGTTQYCFDRFGNVVRKVQASNGKTYTLRYSYTLGGQLSSITYPDNLLIDYVRNGQARITQIGVTPSGGERQVLLTGATYAPFGPATGWSYGNGRTMQRTLNQDYQPNIINGGPGGLSLGYGFDPVGNLTTLRPHLQTDPPVATYVYDRLNRLSDVKDGPTGTVLEHYGYDATGNRLSVTAAGATTVYTYPDTNHRLTQAGTVARSYDAVGNTTQIGGTARQFVYNDIGRLSQVKAGTTVTMNYLYNGKGEQVRKYLGTTNTYTLYDEAGHWLGDYDTAGAPIQQAIWLDDLPVGVMVGAATQKLHYIQPDHLGTPRVLIDPTLNVAVWKWDLKGEAFGATLPNQNPDGDANLFVFNMRYPGQRYDAASGLNYNYFRDYEPGSGRYVQSDPIGLDGGINTYGYAIQSPLLWIDPTGENVIVEGARRGFETGMRLPIPHPGGRVAAGAVGALIGAGVGAWIMCSVSEEEKKERNCQALKDSILNTCYRLEPRKRMRCFEAANTSFRQCMGYE